jgi:hypothetical protein
MPKRHIMRIELTGPAKKKLEELSDRHGMTQVAMMSRLVEFFASRNEQVQTAMVGYFPDEMRGQISQLILGSLK